MLQASSALASIEPDAAGWFCGSADRFCGFAAQFFTGGSVTVETVC